METSLENLRSMEKRSKEVYNDLESMLSQKNIKV